MGGRALTLFLGIVFLASCAMWLPKAASNPLPGLHTGFAPVQPIAYSHKLHAGELGISCTYCHWAADKSRHAGIPAASICMNCHRDVTATVAARLAETKAAEREQREPQLVASSEIKKIYDHLGLDSNMEPDPEMQPQPIRWKRVYEVPDFVYFDHRPHVGAGVRCQQCHGEVQTMDRVRQVGSLSMGWCVSCHRNATEHGINGKAANAKVECTTCHR
jgi:hypothetical protein